MTAIAIPVDPETFLVVCLLVFGVSAILVGSGRYPPRGVRSVLLCALMTAAALAAAATWALHFTLAP